MFGDGCEVVPLENEAEYRVEDAVDGEEVQTHFHYGMWNPPSLSDDETEIDVQDWEVRRYEEKQQQTKQMHHAQLFSR